MPIPKIKYSSSSDEQTSANSASSEVDSHESWTPNKHDSNPYLQFEFPPGNTVIGIQIKGKEEKNEWVTKFTISYSVDGIVWIPLNKIFDGNSKEHSETIIFFDQSIPSNAAYVRVYPIEYHEHISLLAQLLQDCQHKTTTTETPTTPTPTPTVTTTSIQTTTPCSIPMENPEISYSSGDVPGPGKPWSPSSDDNSPFIEVKIPPGSTFVGVITEGNPDQPQWVSKYEISYTTDGVHWVVIDKVFEGNHDSITEQTNYVVPSIPNVVAIRIIPVEWIDNGVKHTDESYEKISIIVTVLLDCKASSTTTETPTTPTPTPTVTTTSIQTTTPCSIPMENPEISYSSGDVPGPGKPWSPSSDDK
ncbi:unnamed protein product [Lampetra planeri]